MFRQQTPPLAPADPPPLHLDLRTPRSTFNTFLRAVFQERPETLWSTLDVNLRFLLERQLHREGAPLFFQRLREVVAGRWGPLRLGPPSDAGQGRVACPLLEAGQVVGTACFQVHGCTWLLASLS